MSELKRMAISIVISAPLFLVVGYKWGEHITANEFISVASISDATETKIYTKMGVLLYNQEYEILEKSISAMAHTSYFSMQQRNQQFGHPIDKDADEYFNSNKSKLAPIAP